MSAIRFSVIIPFHNQRKFVKDAVGSVLSQRNEDIEIIVVDDCSTDGTSDALREYGGAVQLVLLEENAGVSVARNRGASVAKGEYLAFLDGDDAFLPWTMDVYGTIVELKKPKIVIGEVRWFEGAMPDPGEAPNEIQLVEHTDYLAKDRPTSMSASVMVIERRSFEKVNGWSEIFPYEDRDLLLKLGTAGRTIQVVRPPTVLWRIHPGQVSRRFFLSMDDPWSTFAPFFGKERLGQYPGGRVRRLERRANLGTAMFYWVTQAAKNGKYSRALKFAVQTRVMVAAAFVLKLKVAIRGRRCSETMAITRSRAGHGAGR